MLRASDFELSVFCLRIRQKTSDVSLLHMKGIHPLPTELRTAARFGVKVVLSFAAHGDLAVLAHFEAF